MFKNPFLFSRIGSTFLRSSTSSLFSFSRFSPLSFRRFSSGLVERPNVESLLSLETPSYASSFANSLSSVHAALKTGNVSEQQATSLYEAYCTLIESFNATQKELFGSTLEAKAKEVVEFGDMAHDEDLSSEWKDVPSRVSNSVEYVKASSWSGLSEENRKLAAQYVTACIGFYDLIETKRLLTEEEQDKAEEYKAAMDEIESKLSPEHLYDHFEVKKALRPWITFETEPIAPRVIPGEFAFIYRKGAWDILNVPSQHQSLEMVVPERPIPAHVFHEQVLLKLPPEHLDAPEPHELDPLQQVQSEGSESSSSSKSHH